MKWTTIETKWQAMASRMRSGVVDTFRIDVASDVSAPRDAIEQPSGAEAGKTVEPTLRPTS